MTVADPYALAVLSDAVETAIMEGRLSPLQSYTMRLFLSEMSKTEEPANYHRRADIVGRFVDAAEVIR
ncbi:hypothetical protein [Neoaquamicrobium sediminum]|uniref:Uncharacterized protein n=1 Tax=Neoaquamicrobium sediminum TaxID=1849104 RepID=A0ABV3WSN6_9HYPH